MSDPIYCPISRKFCSCNPRCNDEDYGSDYDAVIESEYCLCDTDADEEEQASGRCKACGKPL